MSKLLNFAALLLALVSLCSAAQAESSDQQRLVDMTKSWVAHWRVMPGQPTDFETLRALYSEETYTSYDFGPPAEGFRSFKPAWAFYQALMTSSPITRWQLKLLEAPDVEHRDGIAWSTSIVSLDAEMNDGKIIAVPVARVTLIFEREEDGWKIVHEHGSVPLSLE